MDFFVDWAGAVFKDFGEVFEEFALAICQAVFFFVHGKGEADAVEERNADKFVEVEADALTKRDLQAVEVIAVALEIVVSGEVKVDELFVGVVLEVPDVFIVPINEGGAGDAEFLGDFLVGP